MSTKKSKKTAKSSLKKTASKTTKKPVVKTSPKPKGKASKQKTTVKSASKVNSKAATKKTTAKKTAKTAKTTVKKVAAPKSAASKASDHGNSIGSFMADVMNKYASHLSTVAIAVCVSILTSIGIGCKSIPSVDGITTMSKAVGVATGTACNMTKIDDTTRNAIVDIVNTVDACVPQTNQTFEAAWYPIAERHVAKLVEEKKIDDAQGVIICTAFKTVCKGADYMFDVKWPKARQYSDLVSAASHGFTDGFLAVFKPVNVVSAANNTVMMDIEAYKYLMRQQNSKK